MAVLSVRIGGIPLSRYLALVPFVVLAAACNQLPPRRGADVQTQTAATLRTADPVEIVIAPVIDARTQKGREMALPTGNLRAALQTGLVQRRYSPLNLDLVDTKVVNAAYRPGSLDEQAVLQLTVERWDTSLWTVRQSITATLDARLLSPTGTVLWSGRLEDTRFDFADIRDQYTTETALIRHACAKVTTELLAALPPREPRPGTAEGAGSASAPLK